MGVKTTTLETAETHRAKEIVNTGIYSVVRHPQYLGGLFGHIGIGIVLSAFYASSFFSTYDFFSIFDFLERRKRVDKRVRESIRRI